MDDLDAFVVAKPVPTSSRPLLGLTALVVEDRRFACEAMRLLCLRSGARIRRADCLRSARRHLQVCRPSVVIIDLGLPDGSGTDLITELNQTVPRVEVILGTSGDDAGQSRAIAAGADGFMPKPITSLAVFQEIVLSRLPADRRPMGPRCVSEEEITPDPIAFRDDMAHVADVMGEECIRDEAVLDYIAQFVTGVARSADDTTLQQAAEALAQARASGGPVGSNAARVAGLIQDRLAQKVAI